MTATCERCGQPLPQSRSVKSHNHYFAAMHEMWMHAPEAVSQRFATPEHLRKYCLIKTGFYTEASFAFASSKEAHNYATWFRPKDEFSIVEINDTVVTIFTAMSQSRRDMGGPKFQQSKRAVLDRVAQLCDCDPVTLARNVHLEDLLNE